MAARKTANLRSVSKDETPPPPAPPPPVNKTVSQAAASGTPRELLVALRDRAAASISADSCSPRDVAALTRQILELANDIAAIDQQAREAERDGAAYDSDEPFDAQAI